MDEREKRWLGREVAELVKKLPDKDARRLRKALSHTGGCQQFVNLLIELYRMPSEQRVGVLARLQQMNQLRSMQG